MKLLSVVFALVLVGCDSKERKPVAITFPGGSGKVWWVTNEDTFIVDYGTNYAVLTVINRTKPQ